MRIRACVAEMRKMYQGRRDVVMEGPRETGPSGEYAQGHVLRPGVRCPEGFTSSEFTAHVLRNCGVVTTPGNGFGPSGEGYIRFALTVPEARLKEALERIEKAGF